MKTYYRNKIKLVMPKDDDNARLEKKRAASFICRMLGKYGLELLEENKEKKPKRAQI